MKLNSIVFNDVKFTNDRQFFLNPETEHPNNEFVNIQILTALEQIVFSLNDENIYFSVQKTMNLFNANFPYSFNLSVCMLVHAAFSSLRGGFENI